MLNTNCLECRQRFLPLPDLSRKIEGDSVRWVVMALKYSFFVMQSTWVHTGFHTRPCPYFFKELNILFFVVVVVVVFFFFLWHRPN